MNLAQLCCVECSGGCSKQEHTSIINEWCDSGINELNRCVEQCRVKNSVVHNLTIESIFWSEDLKKLKQQSADLHGQPMGKPSCFTKLK